jgi:hypothetical protein
LKAVLSRTIAPCIMRIFNEDLYRKFSPEITENELSAAVNTMAKRGQIKADGSLLVVNLH